MPKPYVGVTGVTSARQAEAIAHIFDRSRFGGDHALMLGLEIAAEVILRPRGGPPGELGSLDALEAILTDEVPAGVARIAHLHYRDQWALAPALRHLSSIGNLTGVQVVGPGWPDALVLADYLHGARVDRTIDSRPWLILELTAEMAQGRLPSQLVDQVRLYQNGDGPTHLLFAWSGCRGQEFDADRYRPQMNLFRAELPNLRLGVAGGLCAPELWRLEPLAGLQPYGVDAQDRLKGADGELDLDRVAEYLGGLASVFATNR